MLDAFIWVVVGGVLAGVLVQRSRSETAQNPRSVEPEPVREMADRHG